MTLQIGRKDSGHRYDGSWPTPDDRRRHERRQYRLWATAILITLLLTMAAASLAFSLFRAQGEMFFFLDTKQVVLALLGLVSLFDVYVIYQQVQNRRVHRLLDEQHEILEIIGRNAADMIAVVDFSGRRVYNSPSYQQVLGYSPEELRTTSALDQIHPDDRQLVKEAAEEARKTGKGRHVEYRFRHKNGTWRILESTASVARNAAGDADKLVIINRDVTGRKQVEEEGRENQFRQARKMEAVGRLSGGIAHDFNNLLGVILGYVEILEDPEVTGDVLRKGVEEIKKAGQRAASLTRQLLAFSRQQVLAPKVLDLNAVVSDVGGMLRRLIGEDIELETILGENLWRVLADQGQIEQVIMNLATNARDAMPDGGRLTIRTANVELLESDPRRSREAPPGHFVQLSVSDSGIGMDAETQAHIFEPFFTTKELGRGTGLGLSTVFGVVKQSNGFMWVASQAGKGTTFEIYLPQTNGQIAMHDTDARQPDALRMGETILLVEDEESLRVVTRTLLLQSGYQVLDAENGARALEVAQQHDQPIHLLLTDVIMPGMNGPALAGKLISIHPETKILYMSGYTDQIVAQHGIESGTHLLDKPFTRDALKAKVRVALEASRQGLPKAFTSRRSERVRLPMRIRVERDARNRDPFSEETSTLIVNAHGALIILKTKPQLHEILRVHNISTNEVQESVVVFLSDVKDGVFGVGIEFTRQNSSFWRIAFPPRDWSTGRPDAKAREDWEAIQSCDINQKAPA